MLAIYICELLNRYDNVTLPGLGTFVLKYIPAYIHPIENKLTSPIKQVTFDPSVIKNDGILANYISEKEKISFVDACKKIIVFVEKINKTLVEGNEIKLDKIGVFSKGQGNTLLFVPDTSVNYNQETFGLREINAVPILRNDIKERIQKHFSEKTQPSDVKRRLPKVAILILTIVIIIVCCSAALLIINPDFIKNINLVGFFKKSEKNVDTLAFKEPKKNEIFSVTSKDVKSLDSVKTDTIDIQTIKNEKINTSNQLAKGVYYIISASFRIKENADNYALTLRQKNYNSEVIYLPDKALYVVSYNSFSSKIEAEQALLKIVSVGNPDAWILEY